VCGARPDRFEPDPENKPGQRRLKPRAVRADTLFVFEGEATTRSASPARRTWTALTQERSRTPDAAARFAAWVVVASRLVVWFAGLGALAIFGRNGIAAGFLDGHGASAPFHSAAANFVLSPAARWDSVWYLTIAHSGYYSPQSSAMFPLYPLLIHLGSMVFRSELIVGLVISLASVTAALSILYRLVALDIDEKTARTTVLLIAFFPVAFFFSAVYTESLYLFLSIGAIYAARVDRWAWAGLLGGLAAATRSAGILVVVPIALIYLYGPRPSPRSTASRRGWWPRHHITRDATWLALIPVGLVAYLTYLGIAHHQPLAPFAAEHYWGRYFAGPFGGVWHAITALPDDVRRVVSGKGLIVGPGDPLTWNAHDLIDLGFLAFAVAGLIGAWRRVPFAYFAYAVVLLAQATSYPSHLEPLESISRFVMVIFPVFIGWALLLRRSRALTIAVLGASSLLLVVFSGLWGTWSWVA
jgi:Mannosyltransferase (PIG-V)